MRVFYFGCRLDGKGHYLHDARMLYAREEILPWKSIDGTLCPNDARQEQGIARLHKKDGWTAIAFWDRSGDRRGNSNTAFMVDADVDYLELCVIAKQAFPKVWERFTFNVVDERNLTPECAEVLR